ncbi:MAG: hypothetical protein MUC94_02620 [bacterium]|jgi:hypothetical protein|nr:hypothetical protein [bacterium]
MKKINFNIQPEADFSMEEKIRISSYRNSEALKEQIRKTTESYLKMGWRLINISSEGGFIFLKFRGTN